MFDGLPNLRLPEAPGIRNAPTLRQRPDNAETPLPQFHGPTTGTGLTDHSRFNHPTENTPPHIGAPAPRIRKHELLGGLINEYEAAA